MFSPRPAPSTPADVLTIATILDRALAPLGFAPGQASVNGRAGQIVFCRGVRGSVDGGCVDLVIDVEASPEWRIADVRYWGFPSDRWRLRFEERAELSTQIEDLARRLPAVLHDQRMEHP